MVGTSRVELIHREASGPSHSHACMTPLGHLLLWNDVAPKSWPSIARTHSSPLAARRTIHPSDRSICKPTICLIGDCVSPARRARAFSFRPHKLFLLLSLARFGFLSVLLAPSLPLFPPQWSIVTTIVGVSVSEAPHYGPCRDTLLADLISQIARYGRPAWASHVKTALNLAP
jgi:hypothetical protein